MALCVSVASVLHEKKKQNQGRNTLDYYCYFCTKVSNSNLRASNNGESPPYR